MPTRRQFLTATTAATFGVWIASQSEAQESKSPNEKLNIAAIGTKNRARDNINGVKSENIVALCDVDDSFMAEADKLFPKARRYADWRKLLDESKDIDAVVVATPDHHHAPATLAALALGKHVYCEKPLTHTVDECKKVIAAAAKAKKATQMGTQIHAGDNYRRVVEILQSGAIGPVKRIHVWVPGARVGGDRPKETPPVPPTLHWDLWLGPAPYRPYSPAYHPFNWRGWWDFGGGTLADMACHHMDLSHWAFGLTYPTTVEARGPKPHPESCPAWLEVDYTYPARGNQPPILLTWYDGDHKPPQMHLPNAPKRFGAGSIFEGEKGTLFADYGQHFFFPSDDFKDYKPPTPTIPKSIGHHAEWIKACKDGSPTTCNFAYSGPLALTVLLGNVAFRSGQKLEWDAAKLQVTNAPEAQKYISKEYRKGWEI